MTEEKRNNRGEEQHVR